MGNTSPDKPVLFSITNTDKSGERENNLPRSPGCKFFGEKIYLIYFKKKKKLQVH